jgi:molybdopterin synthase catalytic subunit
MFELVSYEIDSAALCRRMTSPGAGALVTFEGRVRNESDGKIVERLEYEAYETMALKEAGKVLDEARRLYPVIDLYCVHRVGRLAIGDLAIWVGALSAHRHEAFSACRFVIDHIKARVPIWKKEYYADGSSIWVNCADCAAVPVHEGAEHECSG